MSNNILLIEDNAEMAENISGILTLARYKVTHASNGKLGVESAKQNPPDLILCDIMMPELDGYSVMELLSRDKTTAGIPFIFITSKTEKDDFRKGMNLGADDYITKPFDGIDLLKVVEMRLKKSKFYNTVFANSAAGVNAFFDSARELKDFRKLSDNKPARGFKKKSMIYREGQVPNELYFIEEGQVKTFKVNSDGKELITEIHKEGEFLGYVPLLRDMAYSENAEALTDVRISLIPKSDFLTLLYSNSEVARKFIKMLSNNISEMETRLLDLAYRSVRQRVASSLLKIHNEIARNGAQAIISIPRKDISSIIGTATESLNRTLADFKSEGVLEILEEGLKIINKPKLEKIIGLNGYR